MFGKRKSATKLNNKNIKKWEEKTTDSEKKTPLISGELLSFAEVCID